MKGFRCLALETGVPKPSVAAGNGERQCELWLSGEEKVAAALFETIDRALAEVDLRLEELDCIAFGKGPGAFTGLRVAAAAAQGLGAGLGVSLCPVSSLAALAQDAYERVVNSGDAGQGVGDGDRRDRDLLGPMDGAVAGIRIAPCLPAGRDQVYMGWYQADDYGLVSPRAEDWLASATAGGVPGPGPFIAAGKGWAQFPALQTAHSSRLLGRQEDALPRARTVLRLAQREYKQGRLSGPEDAQPVYLRDAV